MAMHPTGSLTAHTPACPPFGRVTRRATRARAPPHPQSCACNQGSSQQWCTPQPSMAHHQLSLAPQLAMAPQLSMTPHRSLGVCMQLAARTDRTGSTSDDTSLPKAPSSRAKPARKEPGSRPQPPANANQGAPGKADATARSPWLSPPPSPPSDPPIDSSLQMVGTTLDPQPGTPAVPSGPAARSRRRPSKGSLAATGTLDSADPEAGPIGTGGSIAAPPTTTSAGGSTIHISTLTTTTSGSGSAIQTAGSVGQLTSAGSSSSPLPAQVAGGTVPLADVALQNTQQQRQRRRQAPVSAVADSTSSGSQEPVQQAGTIADPSQLPSTGPVNTAPPSAAASRRDQTTAPALQQASTGPSQQQTWAAGTASQGNSSGAGAGGRDDSPTDGVPVQGSGHKAGSQGHNSGPGRALKMGGAGPDSGLLGGQGMGGAGRGGGTARPQGAGGRGRGPGRGAGAAAGRRPSRFSAISPAQLSRLITSSVTIGELEGVLRDHHRDMDALHMVACLHRCAVLYARGPSAGRAWLALPNLRPSGAGAPAKGSRPGGVDPPPVSQLPSLQLVDVRAGEAAGRLAADPFVMAEGREGSGSTGGDTLRLMGQLLHILQPRLQELRWRELSSLLWALGTLQLMPATQSGLLPSVLGHMEAVGFQHADTQAISNTVWALARLHAWPDRVWTSGMLRVIARKMPIMQAQHLSTTLWGLGVSRVVPPPAWRALALREVHRAMPSRQELRLLLATNRPARPPHPAPRYGPRLTCPQQYANILYALVRLGATPPSGAWMLRFWNNTQALLARAARAAGDTLTDTRDGDAGGRGAGPRDGGWDGGRRDGVSAGGSGDGGTWRERDSRPGGVGGRDGAGGGRLQGGGGLVQGGSGRAQGGGGLPQDGPRDRPLLARHCVMLLWGAAHLREVRPSGPWMRAMEQQLAMQVPHMTAHEICNVTYAYGRLAAPRREQSYRYHPPPDHLLEALVSWGLRRRGAMTPQGVANMVWALARLRLRSLSDTSLNQGLVPGLRPQAARVGSSGSGNSSSSPFPGNVTGVWLQRMILAAFSEGMGSGSDMRGRAASPGSDMQGNVGLPGSYVRGSVASARPDLWDSAQEPGMTVAATQQGTPSNGRGSSIPGDAQSPLQAAAPGARQGEVVVPRGRRKHVRMVGLTLPGDQDVHHHTTSALRITAGVAKTSRMLHRTPGRALGAPSSAAGGTGTSASVVGGTGTAQAVANILWGAGVLQVDPGLQAVRVLLGALGGVPADQLAPGMPARLQIEQGCSALGYAQLLYGALPRS